MTEMALLSLGEPHQFVVVASKSGFVVTEGLVSDEDALGGITHYEHPSYTSREQHLQYRS